VGCEHLIGVLALSAIPLAAAGQTAGAQSGAGQAVPVETTESEQAAEHKTGEFHVPDVPDHWLSWSKYDGRAFSLQLDRSAHSLS
jgi:hypothetical protein